MARRLIESFNGSLRDACLNEENFDSLADARQKLALWRYDDNTVRPHASLGNQTPSERARHLSNLRATHPARVLEPKPKTINQPDSRYERGTTGARVSIVAALRGSLVFQIGHHGLLKAG